MICNRSGAVDGAGDCEFIRDLHNDPSLRIRPVEQVLTKMIEYGGPLLYHGGEDQQRSFGSTCRKLRRFLIEKPR
jgi:hypothetical protein